MDSSGQLKPGKYRHFKGGEYELLFTASDSETLEPVAVYRALCEGGGTWTRPVRMWDEEVERSGVKYKRFTYIDEAETVLPIPPLPDQDSAKYEIVSVRGQPEFTDTAIAFFQKHWATAESLPVYDDCIRHCAGAEGPLPQWYLLLCGSTVIGGAGLITNDFISRMDLYPWICALYIEEAYRGHACGALLLEKAKSDAAAAGFGSVCLCTDHIGYYEHYGFEFIGTGYHPWGGTSRIYRAKL